jgi:hypothetical protein
VAPVRPGGDGFQGDDMVVTVLSDCSSYKDVVMDTSIMLMMIRMSVICDGADSV